MSTINVYVIGDPDQAPTRLSSKSDSSSNNNNNNNETSPLCLRANIPAKILSQGQLTAFIRHESKDGGNADELYYEASLKLISQNGEEFSIGKLSKTNKCLHWDGEINSPEDGVLVVEADWREFRMHAISKTETKENSTSSTTPKASKSSSAASHLKRKRSPLTVKDEQRQNDVSTTGSNDSTATANSTATATTTIPSFKKSKAAANNNNSKTASLMSPASRKGLKPSASTDKTPTTPTSSKLAKLFHNQASKKAAEEVRESSTTTKDSTPTTKVYNPNTASGTFLNMLLAVKDDDASNATVDKQTEKKPEKSKEKKAKKKLRLQKESGVESTPTISSTSSSATSSATASTTSSSAMFLVQALLQDDDEGQSKSRDNKEGDDDEFELISTGVLEPSPSVRWGHSQCLVTSPSGNHVVVIGGQSVKSSFCRDATWLYDPSFGEWEALETGASGGASSPGMRMGHSSVFDPEKNSIFVYGGSKNCRWFKDMHTLSLDAGGWQELKTTGEAPTRAYHSAILHRNEIWIFGGVFPNPGTEPDGCSNSIEVYSSETGGWYSPEVTGTKPLPRSGHSASLLGDKMLIFGGWDMPAIFNDVHVFDLTFAEWTSPSCIQGSPPPSRCWHASALITRPHPRLFIHGGFNGDRPLSDAWILDLPTGLSNSPSVTAKPQWTKISLPDVNLNARAGHTAVSVIFKTEEDDDEADEADEEERIVLFGGGNNSGNFFNTTTVIRVPTHVKL